MDFFEITHNDSNSRARTGVLHTDHGDVRTPAFMPVGTVATVKGLDVRDLHEIDSDIILNNTYHLHLRPGEDFISEFGGVHAFAGWDKPVLTDSGGFQVFSLGGQKGLVSIDKDGVDFVSHIDGSKHRFTPEEAIRVQQKLGADIIMAFDQCTADDVDRVDAQNAMELTHAWAQRCIDVHRSGGVHAWKQNLFGIIQGAFFQDLREESAKVICSMDFDGIAIGGESIGYHMEHTSMILDWIGDILPEDKPRYTMGVGSSPLDLLAVVEKGVDMFDCVAPTRMARHGTVFSRDGGIEEQYRLSLTKSRFREDALPMCSWCTCKYCKESDGVPAITRRYLHHLFKTHEMLGARIATYHNVFFMEQCMREMREAIALNDFSGYAQQWRS